MLRNEKHDVRIWNDGEMIYPSVYSFVKKPGKPMKLRCVINRVPIETNKFMLPIFYDGQLIYEQDIITCKTCDTKTKLAGVVKVNDELCCYAVYCMGKSYPLMNVFEITTLGNSIENPDLLTDLGKANTEERHSPVETKSVEKVPDEQLEIKAESKSEPTSPAPTADWEKNGFDKSSVIISTDGACINNPGPGGSAFVVRSGVFYYENAYSHPAIVTNNICEITAVIHALRAIPKGCDVTLYSDSTYVVNAFNQGWIAKWIKNSWIKTDGKEVKNIPLWMDLMEAASPHKIKWIWIKGHAGNPDNERCDKLAVEAAEKAAKMIS